MATQPPLPPLLLLLPLLLATTISYVSVILHICRKHSDLADGKQAVYNEWGGETAAAASVSNNVFAFVWFCTYAGSTQISQTASRLSMMSEALTLQQLQASAMIFLHLYGFVNAGSTQIWQTASRLSMMSGAVTLQQLRALAPTARLAQILEWQTSWQGGFVFKY